MSTVINAENRFKSPDQRDEEKPSIEPPLFDMDGFDYAKLLKKLLIKPIIDNQNIQEQVSHESNSGS